MDQIFFLPVMKDAPHLVERSLWGLRSVPILIEIYLISSLLCAGEHGEGSGLAAHYSRARSKFLFCAHYHIDVRTG